MQIKHNAKYLPNWILPEDETVKRDAMSATECYAIGVKEAAEHRYKILISDPKQHIYNLDQYTGFANDLKVAYSYMRGSEKLKNDFCISDLQDEEALDEFRFWSYAPLQTIARRVGAKALPGLHAIALVTGDWTHYQGFLNLFLSVWLPEADVIARKYHETPRYISRTAPMYHQILPHMDAMRDKVIEINNSSIMQYPEITKSLIKLSAEDFG